MPRPRGHQAHDQDGAIRSRLEEHAAVVLPAVRYCLEDYGATDWAVDGVGLAAARNVVSFGREMPGYGNGLFSISVETRP